jgi:pimeloyl-ACP methyl ester carboxylesterase
MVSRSLLYSSARRWGAGAALLTVTLSLGVTRSAAASTGGLAWTDCGDGFECATETVPLDYSHPAGHHIDVAVVRLPATDPAHREGSIFVNPGGPGISGVRVTRGAARGLFTDAVRARYDIVGFDPRGVGASTPVRCFASNADAQAFWAGTPIFPITPRQERAVTATAADYARRCAQHSGDLLAHLTSADVARDMDRLRADLGDAQLNYFGLSYGSYLGQVYANLFPGRVRAMVLDGVVDPHAWAQDTVGLLTSQAGAAEHTLDAFLTLCAAAGTNRCAFADPATTPAAKLDRLLDRARHGTLIVPGSQPPQPVTYQDLIGGVAGALDEPGSWARLARALQALVANDPTGAGALQAVGIPPVPAQSGPDYDNTQDASHAISCTDTNLPRDPSTWPALRHRMPRLLGPVRLYNELPCATWPTSPDRYTGPWNRHTGTPILVVGVTGDPSTPYPGAAQAVHRLGNARLLTVDGYGHTSLHAGSSCAIAAENQYLLTAHAPAAGTRCDVKFQPF